jgi:hypothetical protein
VLAAMVMGAGPAALACPAVRDAGLYVTVYRADAETLPAAAVTGTDAETVGSMTTEARKEPSALTVKGTAADPAVNVPELRRAKPEPVTITEAPAGPATALNLISALPAASAGTEMPSNTAREVTTPDTNSRTKRFLNTQTPQ